MRARWLLALVWMAAGCDGGWDKLDGGDTTGAGDPDGDGDDASQWEEGSDGSDIWQMVYMPDQCVDFDSDGDGVGEGVAGAASFFVGDFRVLDSGAVTGREYWLLVANPRWQELGEDDCQVVWEMTGSWEEPTDCGSCDYRLTLSGEMNRGISDCPDGLQDLEQSFEVSYNVSMLSNGQTFFMYSDSGSLLGEGFWDGNRVTYVTDPRCMWF